MNLCAETTPQPTSVMTCSERRLGLPSLPLRWSKRLYTPVKHLIRLEPYPAAKMP
jgi:hypothetical protein